MRGTSRITSFSRQQSQRVVRSNGGRSCCNRAGETEARACRLSVAVLATDFSGRSLTILSTHRPLQVPC